jgi:hypothetical protein
MRVEDTKRRLVQTSLLGIIWQPMGNVSFSLIS